MVEKYSIDPNGKKFVLPKDNEYDVEFKHLELLIENQCINIKVRSVFDSCPRKSRRTAALNGSPAAGL